MKEADDERVTRAVGRLRLLGGLNEDHARLLVDAAIEGAIDHTFELVIGSGPVPTSVTTTKADQLRWICERAGRLLSQREVELVFRIQGSSAKTILNVMRATYEESLRERFVERMRADVKVTASGSNEAGLTWTLRFSESGMFDAAESELARLGLLNQADSSATGRRITLPRTVQLDENSVDPLPLLEIPSPRNS